MTLKKLIKKIRSLSERWGLLEHGDLEKQSLKVFEEVGELFKAYLSQDKEGIKDAIGDIGIALMNYMFIQGHSVTHVALVSIGQGVSYSEKSFKTIAINLLRSYDFYWLSLLSNKFNLDLFLCIEHSYNQIKNRTGRMVDGCFVKDEPKEFVYDNEVIDMLKRIHKHAESMNLTGGIDHNEIKQLIERTENHESTSSPSP